MSFNVSPRSPCFRWGAPDIEFELWTGVWLSLELDKNARITLEALDEPTTALAARGGGTARLEVAAARGGGALPATSRELEPGHRYEFSAGSELVVRAKK